MKKVVLQEDVDQILNQAFWSKSGVSLNESTEQVEAPVEAEEQEQDVEATDEVEGHVCPLCESTLEEAISDDRLKDHVELITSIINEVHDLTDDEVELAEDDASEEVSEDEDTENSEDSIEEVCSTSARKMNKADAESKDVKKAMFPAAKTAGKPVPKKVVK